MKTHYLSFYYHLEATVLVYNEEGDAIINLVLRKQIKKLVVICCLKIIFYKKYIQSIKELSETCSSLASVYD